MNGQELSDFSFLSFFIQIRVRITSVMGGKPNLVPLFVHPVNRLFSSVTSLAQMLWADNVMRRVFSSCDMNWRNSWSFGVYLYMNNSDCCALLHSIM